MIELLLLLLGAPLLRRKWWFLGGIGLTWLAAGVFFFVNALFDEFRIWPAYFALPLMLDAAVSLFAGIAGSGTARTLRLGKALVLIVISLLILAPWRTEILIGLLVGAVIIVDACWRAASAWVVRFSKWRRTLVLAGFEFLFGVWSLVPWPTQWRGQVGIDVGTLMFVTGASLLLLAFRIRRLPPGTRIARALSDGWTIERRRAAALPMTSPRVAGALTVHVWTPTGALVPLSRGIARYVAALDEKGVVSTGHAALEVVPDIYISHYPAVEIDRDQSQFTRTLRATDENNVPGRFQPSYAVESEEWCPSTRQVRLDDLDVGALREFWSVYGRDTTYNLTNRNCSSAVAKALDAAVEGVFAEQGRSPWFVVRLLFLPELWAAGVMRRRAAAMAWTPGLVLDYARALSAIVELPHRLGMAGAKAQPHPL
ncbi:hypothetical protein [Bosea sp. 117]|uniref:HdeD family acid-resistance protein n=1 Tax=Bosea sp. 117 TaxID=1125973 RepID=UPI0004943D59|nr:hypothetical protein [Bosea sp. 117]